MSEAVTGFCSPHQVNICTIKLSRDNDYGWSMCHLTGTIVLSLCNVNVVVSSSEKLFQAPRLPVSSPDSGKQILFQQSAI
jgi:hypothetical protein